MLIALGSGQRVRLHRTSSSSGGSSHSHRHGQNQAQRQRSFQQQSQKREHFHSPTLFTTNHKSHYQADSEEIWVRQEVKVKISFFSHLFFPFERLPMYTMTLDDYAISR